MALDFPASPTNGQLFQGSDGVVYQWSSAGGLWLNYGVGMNNAIIATSPPSNPVAGQIWWSPDTGTAYIWFTDVNSSQWVPLCPTPSVNFLGWRQLQRVVPTAGQVTIDFLSIPSDINHLELRFNLLPTIASVSQLMLQFFDSTGTIVNTSYGWTGTYNTSNSGAGAGALQWNSGSAGYSDGIPMFVAGEMALNAGGYGVIQINGFKDTPTMKVALIHAVSLNAAGSIVYDSTHMGWRNMGAISGLRQFIRGGITFAAGGSSTLWGSP